MKKGQRASRENSVLLKLPKNLKLIKRHNIIIIIIIIIIKIWHDYLNTN
jgi:hypothetical protein